MKFMKNIIALLSPGCISILVCSLHNEINYAFPKREIVASTQYRLKFFPNALIYSPNRLQCIMHWWILSIKHNCCQKITSVRVKISAPCSFSIHELTFPLFCFSRAFYRQGKQNFRGVLGSVHIKINMNGFFHIKRIMEKHIVRENFHTFHVFASSDCSFYRWLPSEGIPLKLKQVTRRVF